MGSRDDHSRNIRVALERFSGSEVDRTATCQMSRFPALSGFHRLGYIVHRRQCRFTQCSNSAYAPSFELAPLAVERNEQRGIESGGFATSARVRMHPGTKVLPTHKLVATEYAWVTEFYWRIKWVKSRITNSLFVNSNQISTVPFHFSAF